MYIYSYSYLSIFSQILSIQIDDFYKLNQYSDRDQEIEHNHFPEAHLVHPFNHYPSPPRIASIPTSRSIVSPLFLKKKTFCINRIMESYTNMLLWLTSLFYSFFLNLFIWLRGVLVVSGRLFVAARGLLSCSTQLLSCGMRILSCGMHVGSSSLTRNRTQVPGIGSMESYALCHQGSPLCFLSLHIMFVRFIGVVACSMCSFILIAV